MRMSDETARCTSLQAAPRGKRPLPALRRRRSPYLDASGLASAADLGADDRARILIHQLVVNNFRENQNALAAEYYHAGLHAMEAKQATAAVDDFETALVYSHDNFQYRLKLTDALLASGATGEALAQLHAFWDQRPGDAEVNLKLARLEAKRGQVDDAMRYYQNAIEGAWPERTDPVPQRIAARFEAAEYLVQQGRQEQAEAALLAMAAVLPSSSPEQGQLAELFLRNGDPGRALSAYQAQLNQNKNDNAAILGAAKASFAAGSYATALPLPCRVKTETAESRALREQLERMEALDPFAPGGYGKGTHRANDGRHSASPCSAWPAVECHSRSPHGSSDQTANAKDPEQWSGFAKWAEQLSPMMSERKLRGRDDVIESTMRFAFQAEMAAQKDCGKLDAER